MMVSHRLHPTSKALVADFASTDRGLIFFKKKLKDSVGLSLSVLKPARLVHQLSVDGQPNNHLRAQVVLALTEEFSYGTSH